MNPLIHGELSWLAGAWLPQRRDRVLVTVAGLVPDLDGLTLLAGEDWYGRWHHVLTHGALAGGVTALVALALAKDKLRTAALGVAAFHLHLLCDLAGSGPGWPIEYLWPFSDTQFRWSGQWDLASWQNAAIGLLVTLTALGCAQWVGRTPFELFSVKFDAQVVATIKARLRRSPR